MKKKIVFFDGDGTLWYPSSTKWTRKPHWIYSDEEIGNDYLEHLELTPGVEETLQKLKSKGIILALLSIIPFEIEEAQKKLEEKVAHLKLGKYFDEVIATPDNPEGKGAAMERLLADKKLEKEDALLVGDSYNVDYFSAKNVGIDALLIAAEYRKDFRNEKEVKTTITSLPELLNYVEWF